MTKVVLRHLTAPLSEEQVLRIKQEQKLSDPKACLGGQEEGFFFFTTSEGIEAQKEFAFDTTVSEQGKHRYVAETEFDVSEITYSKWKLDTEATADILFSQIRKEVLKTPIAFDDIKVSSNGVSLNIENGESFHKYKKVTGNESGIIEKITDKLYQTSSSFKAFYDDFLQKIAKGQEGELDKGAYAIKTKDCPLIKSVRPITEEVKQVDMQQRGVSSRLAAFYKKYGR